MTIDLPEELTRFVHDVVRSGRYAREDDVISDALRRLQQALQDVDKTAQEGAEGAGGPKPLTKQEFHRHLVEIGVINQVSQDAPTPSEPTDDLIDGEGEILSERVIRERLIEWLTQFIGD